LPGFCPQTKLCAMMMWSLCQADFNREGMMKFHISKSIGSIALGAALLTQVGCGDSNPFQKNKDPDSEENPNNGNNNNGNNNGSGNAEPGDDKPFIAIDIFNASYANLAAVSRNEVVQMINTSPMFMLRSGAMALNDEGSDPIESDPCDVIVDKVELVDTHTVKMRFKSDTSRCNPEPDEEGITKVVAQRGYGLVKCSESILDSYAGTRASDRLLTDICPNDTRQERTVNIEAVTSFFRGRESVAKTIKFAIMASDGSACVSGRTNTNISIGNCGQYLLAAVGNPKKQQVQEIQKFEAHDLSGVAGNRYFNTGYYDLTINNWKGRMSYGKLGSIPSDNPPTYEIRNASSRENVSGTYQFDTDPSESEEEEQEPEE
jgi:hypothetical protein